MVKLGLLHCKIRFTRFYQDIPEESRSKAEEMLKAIETSFEGLSNAIENKDVPAIISSKRGILNQIGDVEQLMVKGFPYE